MNTEVVTLAVIKGSSNILSHKRVSENLLILFSEFHWYFLSFPKIGDGIFKSRDITLPTKFRLVKAMVFPVVMYGCESWTGKKAERRRIDAFELWCWRRLLRVP